MAPTSYAEDIRGTRMRFSHVGSEGGSFSNFETATVERQHGGEGYKSYRPMQVPKIRHKPAACSRGKVALHLGPNASLEGDLKMEGRSQSNRDAF